MNTSCFLTVRRQYWHDDFSITIYFPSLNWKAVFLFFGPGEALRRRRSRWTAEHTLAAVTGSESAGRLRVNTGQGNEKYVLKPYLTWDAQARQAGGGETTRQWAKCYMTASCSTFSGGRRGKKSQAFVLICMPKSNHFRVSVMIIIMLMMWTPGSGLCKMCVFCFYHFFKITAIVCMYSKYVRVY